MHSKPWLKAAINAVASENPAHPDLPFVAQAYTHERFDVTRDFLLTIASTGGPDRYLAPSTRAILRTISGLRR